MGTILKKILPFTLALGIIALSLNYILGGETLTFITRFRINGIWMYKYDFWKYANELKLNVDTLPNLTLTTFNRNWPTGDISWQQIVDALAYILDIIIVGLNVIIYPLRIGSYATQLLCAVIGLPVITHTDTYPLNWLFNVLNILTTLQIPYV